MKTEATCFRPMKTSCRWAANLVLILTCLGGKAFAEGDYTSSDELIGAVESFLEERVQEYLLEAGFNARHENQINPLDPRLRLAACDKPLTLSQQGTPTPVGRISIKVRCEGSSPWTVFVPVQVKLYRPVVVAVQPLLRGTVLDTQNVALMERDVGVLTQGYLTSLEQVVGAQLKRQVVNEQVLTPAFLEQAELVRKGEQVVISARSASFNIRMQGQALADGAKDEEIRVRNLSSNRVIHARVVDQGQVEVAL
ncbi:flagella basal body P-ring formation protein FlgA [Pseudomonas psychrotolerans]|uniref:Flagella basal body P-ring formation protein FlgA n=2 Tax=Pseudomonas oryzihabitans TaxID=47885 RepID=A0AAJ2BN16_9PSED|nr:flagellar basal body P-ring formation chaperone FlgA [Pseudomonas psychrotolerans]MDR6236045.1 flagella basal body P-ring formation protein FlgA [Pseudomonas psychrotolerans]MDR6354642.1 flagella basal body P-ring formation protein FlgA [Pseudomonas psychrotolerans]